VAVLWEGQALLNHKKGVYMIEDLKKYNAAKDEMSYPNERNYAGPY